MPYPDTVRWAYNAYDNPYLLLAYDMSTRTAGGLMKNLATTGATYDGTINGTYTPAPPLIRAKKSPCMDLSPGDYISLANPISGLTNFTMIFWFNVDNNTDIAFSRAGAGNVYIYLTATGPPFYIQASIAGTGTPSGIVASKLSTLKTYMFAVVYTGSTTLSTIYLDGKIYSKSTYGVNPVDVNAYIGRLWDGSITFNGRLDNFLIFNTALEQEKIQSIYRSSVPR